MSTRPVRLTVLVDHPEAVRALQRAFRDAAGPNGALRLHFARSWVEAHGSAEAASFDLAVVQPSFGADPGDGTRHLREIERLAVRCSPERIILYVCRPASSPTLLRELGDFGFPFCSVLGVDDDPDSLLRIVVRAENRRLLREHLTLRSTYLDRATLSLVILAMTGWPPATTVAGLSRKADTSPRSLRRLAARGGLPPPARLLACGRLLDLALLSGLGIRSRTRLALILDLGGPDALAHLVRRHADMPICRFLSSELPCDPAGWLLSHV